MKNKNLSVVAYANGWTAWLYKDMSISVDEVGKEGFFDAVSDLMAVGDIVWIICQDTVKHMWVKTLRPVSLEELSE